MPMNSKILITTGVNPAWFCI